MACFKLAFILNILSFLVVLLLVNLTTYHNCSVLLHLKIFMLSLDDDNPTPKKKKVSYKVPKDADELIKDDKANKKLWDECLQIVKEGQQVSINSEAKSKTFHV